MAKIEFELEDDYTNYVLKELDKVTPEILSGFGNELQKSIQNFMREDDIYDTGRLLNSISYSTPQGDFGNPKEMNKATDTIRGVREPKTVCYGSNVEYASFVETGTTKQRARHYVQIGTYRASPQMQGLMEKLLRGK